MSAQHTPETWELNEIERPNLNPDGQTPTGRSVGWAQWRQAVYADMHYKQVAWAMGNTHDECQANAALIASAPSLLAERDALKAQLQHLEEGKPPYNALEAHAQIDSFLAKGPPVPEKNSQLAYKITEKCMEAPSVLFAVQHAVNGLLNQRDTLKALNKELADALRDLHRLDSMTNGVPTERYDRAMEAARSVLSKVKP